MIIDSHIHLIAKDYQNNLESFLEEAEKAGVIAHICVGAGMGAESASLAVKLAEKYDCIFAAVGIHPLDAQEGISFNEIKDLATHPKVVAIGETGLDFYYQKDTAEIQYSLFKKHIELANSVNKPLIIHSRMAAAECLDTLQECQALKGVFHCYSEDTEFAKKLQAMNFKVSFPGVITFKNAEATRQAAAVIPLEQIMLETDAPFLAPVPYRGKLCRPAYIAETAKKFAEIRQMTTKECNKIIAQNTIDFFKLPL